MKTFTVEFTGTPEAGKTTCIKRLKNQLEREGYRVDYIQESAEIVPSIIPKGSFDGHLWMRLHSLEHILSKRNANSDLLLIDRGLLDGIFYTYYFLSRNPKEVDNASALIQFLKQLTFLYPDFLFVFTVSPSVSIERRGGEGRLVTLDYVANYNRLLNCFLPEISIPYQVIDSTSLSDTELFEITYHSIQNTISS